MSTAITASAITSVSDVAGAERIKWETNLLRIAEGMLVFDKFATTKVMQRGEAGSLRFNRYLRVAKKTTADTEGTIYGHADAKQLNTNYFDVAPTKWGDSFSFTEEVDIDTFLTDEDNLEPIANQMARSLEYQLVKTVSTGCLRHRIDKDPLYQSASTVDSGSTTTVVDAVQTDIDDYWNGGYLTITNAAGPNYDQTALITAFTAATDTFTFAAKKQAMSSASKYRVTVGTTLAATDKITTTGLLDVNVLHRKLETQPFKGGGFKGFLHADQERDLWDDTLWQNTAIYDDSERFANYSLVRWLGMEFMISSELYREDADGTENQATGVVYVAPIFGQKAYAIVRWGFEGVNDFGVEFVVKDQPDSADLRNSFKAVSWKSRFAAAVLRSTSVIGLMTGATDNALLVL